MPSSKSYMFLLRTIQCCAIIPLRGSKVIIHTLINDSEDISENF